MSEEQKTQAQETQAPETSNEEVKQESKTFTQEQLNNIIESRIMAERRKYEKKLMLVSFEIKRPTWWFIHIPFDIS